MTLIETGTDGDAAGTTAGTATLTDAPTLTDTAKRVDTVRDTAETGSTGMRVTKRNGAVEPVDLNKIVNAIARASEGLLGVDPMRVATRTISALADGATTRELDDLSIRTAAGLIVEEPNYSRLASRLLATVIDKEVRNQNIPWFSESIKVGHAEGLVAVVLLPDSATRYMSKIFNDAWMRLEKILHSSAWRLPGIMVPS